MSRSEWNFETAARHARAELIFHDPLKRWGGASIDTRTLKTGQVFFALKGTNRDGHDYLWEAFRKDASGALIRKDFFVKTREKLFRERTLFQNLLVVSDPEEALASLSGLYRNEFSAVGVGVTGSVGKTSTKEFLHFLLSERFPVLGSAENQNNHLGLPLTLFRLEPEHRFCVAEMAANHRGEIRKLTSLLRPRVGVITGVSPSHLEGFGSVDGIYEAKLELADALARVKGTLVLPDLDPELVRRAKSRKIPILLFGKKPSSDFRLTGVESRDGWVDFEVNGRWSFRFPGSAAFQAENALAALAACFACGVSLSDLPSVWKEIRLPKGRFEVLLPRGGITFVNDCYNANPHSFERALEAFGKLEGGGRKILVLGDMLELGPQSIPYHRSLGASIRAGNFHALLSVGEWMKETVLVCEQAGNPPLALHFENKEMLAHFLGNFLKPADQVLFKASRAVKLEEVIDVLSSPLPIKGIPSPL